MTMAKNEPIRMACHDLLRWDERDIFAQCFQWPTYSTSTYHFKASPSGSTQVWPNVGRFCELLRHGWEPVTAVPVRYGFLWLKETNIWTFRRKMEWDRIGTETSFVGSRVTPSMPDGRHL